MPHVVREGDPEIGIEALPGREELALIAQVPLAHDGRFVPDPLEHLGHRDLVWMQSFLVPRKKDPPALLVLAESNSAGIASRHQRTARRRADVRRYVEAGQFPPFCRHPVEVGRAMNGRAEWSDIRIA